MHEEQAILEQLSVQDLATEYTELIDEKTRPALENCDWVPCVPLQALTSAQWAEYNLNPIQIARVEHATACYIWDYKADKYGRGGSPRHRYFLKRDRMRCGTLSKGTISPNQVFVAHLAVLYHYLQI